MKIATDLKEKPFLGCESYGSMDWVIKGQHSLPFVQSLKSQTSPKMDVRVETWAELDGPHTSWVSTATSLSVPNY